MIKAYGYLRVSGTGQVEGDGFDRQRELIIRFADQAEIVIPRFYSISVFKSSGKSSRRKRLNS